MHVHLTNDVLGPKEGQKRRDVTKRLKASSYLHLVER
jgi:hypothetical protein